MSILIAHDGSPTPFVDQWDLEALGLYKRYLEGRLTLSHLIAAHVDHRMFFTRTLALALFELRGAWDPILEMVADIGFRLLGIWLMLIFLFNRLISAPQAIAVALLCSVLAAIPYASETVLMGYPSNFYFLLIFSFGAFLLLDRSAAWSARWWIGTILAVLSYFNLASGMFTLLAADSVICLQILLRVRRVKGWREYAGLAFHLALVVLMLAAMPARDAGVSVKAESVVEFAEAAAIFAAWPLPAMFWFVLYGPALVFMGLLIIRKPTLLDDRWSYVIPFIWIAAQLAALAYGRGSATVQGIISPRYTDILSVGVVLNFAIALHLCRASPRYKRLAGGLAACWIGAVCIAGAVYAETRIPGELQFVRLITRADYLKSFLETDDASLLAGKVIPDIPYPDSAKLTALLSDPVIRKILPSNLADEENASRYIQQRTYLRGMFSHAAVKTRDWTLQNGYVFSAAGLAFLLLALMCADRDWHASPHKQRNAASVVIVKTIGGLCIAAVISFAGVTAYHLRAARIASDNALRQASTLLPVTQSDSPLIGALDLLRPGKDGQLKAAGWAFSRTDPRRPVFVAIAMDGKIAAVGQTTVQRPDVSGDYKLDRTAAPSGFVLAADACAADVTVFAFTLEGQARLLPHGGAVACPDVKRAGAELLYD
jgi:hypothetical protein